jgi:hypothetical protein
MMIGFDISDWNFSNDSDLSSFIMADDSIDLINQEELIGCPAHTGLISLSVCLSVRLSIRPSVRPSIHPSVRPSIHPEYQNT